MSTSLSQFIGDKCPNCGAIRRSKITKSSLSTRIGNRIYPNVTGLVKRFHVCIECGYSGRDTKDKHSDMPVFNTIAIREDQLIRLLGFYRISEKNHNRFKEINDFIDNYNKQISEHL